MKYFFSFISSSGDYKPLITQELADKINNNPKSTFKTWLNPKFTNLTIDDIKHHLSAVLKTSPKHGSPQPIGADSSKYNEHNITGYTNQELRLKSNRIIVYDIQYFCS